MKRLFLISLLLLAVAGSAVAQNAKEPKNPVKGYVITNSNDTIHGTIDYLMGKENAKACHFQREGETEFLTYGPDDILGYRFQNDSIYFVSRMFPVDGRDTRIFAEYLVQGCVSLYRYEDGAQTLYYMTDDSGKTAVIKEELYNKYTTEEALRLKRENLRDAMDMLSASTDIPSELWHKNISASNLVELISRYNKEYCEKPGKCMVFQYESKKRPGYSAKLMFDAGYEVGRASNDLTSKSVRMPRLGIGCEFTSLRTNPNFSYYLMLVAAKWESDMRIYENKDRALWVELDCGALYRFSRHCSNRRPKPFVCGGLSLAYLMGAYFGAGCEFPVGSHRLQLTATGRYNGYVPFKNALFEDIELGKVLACSLDLTFIL